MTDQFTHLLKEKDRTGARVIGAAINAVRFWEVQDFEVGYRILKEAVDSHNQATRAYIEYLAASPARKESAHHGDQHAAA
jgi:hypothetical protein